MDVGRNGDRYQNTAGVAVTKRACAEQQRVGGVRSASSTIDVPNARKGSGLRWVREQKNVDHRKRRGRADRPIPLARGIVRQRSCKEERLTGSPDAETLYNVLLRVEQSPVSFAIYLYNTLCSATPL